MNCRICRIHMAKRPHGARPPPQPKYYYLQILPGAGDWGRRHRGLVDRHTNRRLHSIQQEQLEIRNTGTQLAPNTCANEAKVLCQHALCPYKCGAHGGVSGFVMVESLGALLAWHGWKCPQRNASLASHMAHNIKLSSDPNNIPPKASNLT